MALAAALLGLASCSPVEAYRNLIGVSKNDPNPATTPNTKNLAAGEARGYPNLATVPPPPTQALTTAQLDKLTQSLIADRANAKYTSEQLRAGFDEAAGAAPPPPPAPASGGAGTAAGATNAGAPSAGGPATAARPGNAAVPGAAPAAAPNSPPSASAASTHPAADATGPRKSGQPPEPGPMESSLQSPRIASLPQPEAFQPAPPPPRGLTMPAAPAGQNAPPAAARLPGPPAPAPLPPELGSAKFQPAPPPPNLPAPAPTRTAAATGGGKAEKPAPPAAYTPVADITFAADSTTLSDADRQILGKVVPRYQGKPGTVRVVGYAGIASSAAQQLSSYRTALDRAHAVAAALARAGIPSDKIEVEAAPAGSDSGQGRAEVLLQR